MIKSLNTKNLLGGLLLGVLASGSAVAADGNLRIGIEAAYPPFSFKTAEGELAGFDYDSRGPAGLFLEGGKEG